MPHLGPPPRTLQLRGGGSEQQAQCMWGAIMLHGMHQEARWNRVCTRARVDSVMLALRPQHPLGALPAAHPKMPRVAQVQLQAVRRLKSPNHRRNDLQRAR